MNGQNEQDLVTLKIEQREKIDTIIAYVLIVVIAVCMALITYLKFFKKEDENPNLGEHEANYITTSEIASSLVNSSFSTDLASRNGSLNAKESDNGLVVTYIDGEDSLNLSIPVLGNELEFTMQDDNEIYRVVYEEIATIICKYYGDTETNCRKVVAKASETTSVNGIRFVSDGDTRKVYVSMTMGANDDVLPVYEEETLVDTSATNYTLRLSDAKISNVTTTLQDNSFTIKGTITRTKEEDTPLSVRGSIYGASDALLSYKEVVFNDENTLTDEGEFTITFNADDTLKMNDILKYSLNITKGVM